MSLRLWRCQASGQDLLLEDLNAGLRFDGPPLALDLDDAKVFRFTSDLIHLGQGVTGVALVGADCLPIVVPDYFRIDRAPASTVRAVDHPPAAVFAEPGARRFFVFGVPGAAGFQFALSMSQVLEVTRALPMAPFNFDHSHLAGVTVWRGETIPVIDLALAARLGSMRDGNVVRMMVVRNRSNRIWAIAANGQVRQPSAASQVYPPDTGSVRPMRGIRGIFRFEGRPLLVPDLDALVD